VLAHLGPRLALTVTREQVLYFERSDPRAFAAGRFPAWYWHGERRLYGLPVMGEPAVKAAEEFTGEETSADARSFAVDEDSRARVHEFVRRTFPGALSGEYLAKTLLYAASADRRPMLGELPGHPEVSVCVGSGDGFGLATQLGRVLAEAARDDRAPCGPFPLALEPRTATAPSAA
jgi:sarcosine oxidase